MTQSATDLLTAPGDGPLVIAGSIASDHLMSYGGVFADSMVVDQLDKISLSFLVDDLEIRRGGVGANVAFGLGRLGLRPVLLGAVGDDFGEYRSWLERHGVDCGHVRISDVHHTARFVCTTDTTGAQIASFYPGAMSEARMCEIAPVVAEADTAPSWVLIGADDPAGMARHTDECRQRGYRFVADPSQQLAFSDGAGIRQLIDGAAILCSNEYESHMIEQKTGWSSDDVLARVGVQVTTLGSAGVRIRQAGQPDLMTAAAADVKAIEPTGVGDGFRAGFLAALTWGLGLERAAQVGCVMAAHVVETVGTQEYSFTASSFEQRLSASYGADVAAEVAPFLS